MDQVRDSEDQESEAIIAEFEKDMANFKGSKLEFLLLLLESNDSGYEEVVDCV